ncbi:hypothetical protein [Streptomyces sp. ISL-100]|uniref:hypothetical protein n=1 Tax=Streptomyces sp. ISL-100 TaxID=2819173 RepID=UPI001BECE122|nr:hypothetical protein [Streptomyces sp. ISL-100]MBT2400819.1 hypothetical protein [Streptomyces sp. ISL-100]
MSTSLVARSAKEASFDAACSIDIELLLGQRLAATKAHLSTRPELSAAAALERLREFEGSSVEEHSAFYDRYYDGYAV